LALSCGKKSTKEENCPPAINELKPSKWAVDFQTDVVITARTSDRDGEKLSSTWRANWGVFKVTS